MDAEVVQDHESTNGELDVSTDSHTPAAPSEAENDTKGEKMALGVLSKFGGKKKSLWKITEEKVVDAYVKPPEDDDHEVENEADLPQDARKFQLKPLAMCKVGLMTKTKTLESMPPPPASFKLNCVSRLHWVVEFMLEISPKLRQQACQWILQKSLPGIPKSEKDLDFEILEALQVAGYAGFKLTRFDLHNLAQSTMVSTGAIRIPFLIEDELLMCTAEYTERRRLAKKDPDLRAVLRSYWSLVKGLKGSQVKYVDMHLAINKSICRSFDPDPSREILIAEWEVLTDGGLNPMSYREFAEALFMCADVWCMSARPAVYAYFLSSILHHISFRRTSSREEPLSLKPLNEIQFMEELYNSLKHPESIGDDDSADESSEEESSQSQKSISSYYPVINLDEAPANPRIRR